MAERQIRTKTSPLSQESVKVPPHDLNAEAAVLSAMLVDDWGVARALELLKEEHFYKRAHRLIFRAMAKLFETNIEVDLITLIDELKKDGHFDNVGGTVYLSKISDIVSSTANIESHAQIVLEKATLRHLINTSNIIIEDCYTSEKDSKVIVEKAEKAIFDVTQNLMLEGFESVSNIIPETLQNIEKIASQKSRVIGVASGFSNLDAKIGGFQPGQFIVVAGRPSMGKTSFAINIAFYTAIHQQKNVGIFSLEMDKEKLLMRMLSSGAEVSLNEMLHGYGIDQNKIFLITTVAEKLSEAHIFIDDRGSNTMTDIRSKARRLKSEEGLDLLIIDYMQLLMPVESRANRQQEMSEISRSIKILAKELRTPIIAVSQLSRAPETRGGEDRRPRLADLRESGAIEQDADMVIFIYREDYYKKAEELETPGIAEIIIGKNRNGPQANIKLKFRSEYTQFGPIDEV
ncbi:MAG: replicative DNA helicase [Candidatus Cloacimonetes bacterium]|nr:replicative DNA helicase [Candidatus Cloacimonadota bacterium]